MPLFEYYCDKCGQNFEVLVLSKEETIHCPACGNTSLQKQFSTFGVSCSTSSPGCAMGACGLPQPAGGCGEGMCSSCMN